MVSSSTNTTTTKKTTMGRRKIEMKKIERPNQLQVTFSKRRSGLFKKASDLCILTGAQVAIIVTSPANHIFAFGHPSVDSILDRYLTGTKISIDEFNPEEYCEKIEEERERGRFWWDECCVENLGVEELEKYMKALEELKINVLNRADELKRMSMIKGFCDGDDDYHYQDTVSFGLNRADELKMMSMIKGFCDSDDDQNRADELKMMSMINGLCDGDDDHDHYRDTVSFGLSESVDQFWSGFLEDVVNFDGQHAFELSNTLNI